MAVTTLPNKAKIGEAEWEQRCNLAALYHILDYLRYLDRFPEFHEVYSTDDYLAVMLAGLLHDLGHYPCAHQLESLEPFPEHEAMTVELIKGRLRFKQENLAELIRSHFGIDADAITQYFIPESQMNPKYRLLRQLIDSPVDGDKCDYLQRDSYFCGVDYGTGFDQDRFVRNLKPSRDQRSLVMHEKGLISAERFQLARYWMYRSVYWGHTVRSLITMLQYACRNMSQQEPGRDFRLQLLQFNDATFFEWLKQQVDPSGQEFIEGILNREPYKRLCTISANRNPNTYQLIQAHGGHPALGTWLGTWCSEHGIDLPEHHLVWDIPPVYKNERWESFLIELDPHGEVPIEQESPVVKALGHAFLQGVRKIRLFCHPQLERALSSRGFILPDLSQFVD